MASQKLLKSADVL